MVWFRGSRFHGEIFQLKIFHGGMKHFLLQQLSLQFISILSPSFLIHLNDIVSFIKLKCRIKLDKKRTKFNFTRLNMTNPEQHDQTQFKILYRFCKKICQTFILSEFLSRPSRHSNKLFQTAAEASTAGEPLASLQTVTGRPGRVMHAPTDRLVDL